MDENLGDKPLSSEELLKRAREGLGESKTPPEPPADFRIESFPPPAPDPAPDAPAQPEEPEPAVPVSAEPDEPVFAASPPSDPSSWAPPPVQAEDESAWEAATRGPAPGPVRKSGGGSVLSKMWIVVILVVGGVALFSFLDSSKSVDDIAVGDCFDYPEQDEFSTVDTIDCAESHELEVFALVDLSAISTEFSAVAAYPGEEAVLDAALDACYDRFEGYVGTPYEESIVYLDAFTPTFEGWTEVDDRIANCVLYVLDAAQEETIKSSESFKNSGK